jgi:hypothetical protein
MPNKEPKIEKPKPKPIDEIEIQVMGLYLLASALRGALSVDLQQIYNDYFKHGVPSIEQCIRSCNITMDALLACERTEAVENSFLVLCDCLNVFEAVLENHDRRTLNRLLNNTNNDDGDIPR